ncbi:unnamed protein product [Owenia fusiformis]|uniref:Protein-arginine deiminase n=1 Tax=Owenia fusiformis TaxID=6347 RepID=A0A8S4NNX1_OWEFU|nr:unnamed protein product [Owenia fusiformis]
MGIIFDKEKEVIEPKPNNTDTSEDVEDSGRGHNNIDNNMRGSTPVDPWGSGLGESDVKPVGKRIRTVAMRLGEKSEEIIVLGTELAVKLYSLAPSHSTSFSIEKTDNVTLRFNKGESDSNEIPGSGMSGSMFSRDAVVYISIATVSNMWNDSQVKFEFKAANGEVAGESLLLLTSIALSLDADINRNGSVEETFEVDKSRWTWGPNGQGAIILVNCDNESVRADGERDTEDLWRNGKDDLLDMSMLVINFRGPNLEESGLPRDYRLRLHTSVETSTKVGIYSLEGTPFWDSKRQVIGKKRKQVEISFQKLNLLRDGQVRFAVEGIQYPDYDFDGIVPIHLSLFQVEDDVQLPIFKDTVTFRVSPWIMTPNNLKPKEVFVCEMRSQKSRNFVENLRELTKEVGVNLTVVKPGHNRGDRWMQDEIEFGYSEAPHKYMPVVLDSPRDRGLTNYPIFSLLGKDFGYVTRETYLEEPNSLDSFGNLEVSPPVKVNGVSFPFGKILIGGTLPGAFNERRMLKVIRNFLSAQKVQPLVELFSDWLTVGHIDEFMTFVPTNDKKSFKLLMASPDCCYSILKKLNREGHGELVLFEGKKSDADGLVNAERTVKDLLRDTDLDKYNKTKQRYLDWNRDTLKRELGLTEEDVIDVPALFHTVDGTGADAIFPGMVNMLVLGNHLGIPKPFGPKIQGICQFESYMRDQLEPLGVHCHFINDWESYHVLLGEIHCGTNTRREPFAYKWWNMEF